MKTQLLVPAAGIGARLGLDRPKALVELAGKPLLVRTLERLEPLGLLDGAVVIVPPGRTGDFERVLEGAFPSSRFHLADGGAERQASVGNGLAALGADVDVVVIHDAARPFVAAESVRASVEAATEVGAATVAIPVIDTILVSDEQGFLEQTPDRSRLWACQTPQTFRTEVIREAHACAARDGFAGTDDASLVRRQGGRVKLVPGTWLNMKITTPQSLAVAEALVKEGVCGCE